MDEVSERLEEQLGPTEEVGSPPLRRRNCCTACTGQRRSTAHAGKRFVEGVLAAFPPFAFDLLAARAHARLWAGLVLAGTDVGPHDRLVAATAITAGWRVGTANVRHFDRIPGLDVLVITWRTEAYIALPLIGTPALSGGGAPPPVTGGVRRGRPRPGPSR